MDVRTTKTGSGNTAVQVVERYNHQTKIIKHFGSAKSTKELNTLITLAKQYIRESNNTLPLFPEILKETEKTHLVSIDHLTFTKTYHQFAYEFFSFFYARSGFDIIHNSILKDLAIIRLIEPASKFTSLELLKEYFNIHYGHTTFYKALKELPDQKEIIETVAINYAQKYLSFDFSLVFYDVTTLYFESFKADEDMRDENGEVIEGLRKPGFSKDNKPQQPQIMIGLVVNNDGYPIAIETFSGNTFEGHTMIPIIQKLQKKHTIHTLTIVADAGMLSKKNIEDIEASGLTYIVGARLGNIPMKTLKEISQELNKTEGVYSRMALPYGLLICDYSKKRAAKDRSDRNKQLKKAEYQIQNPEKTKRRTRFVTEESKSTIRLNTELIIKDELKEGLKGYYTNLEYTDNELIIARYKDLWHVEKSFRIAKSDLEARPIFHHKKDSIEAHILIVFVSLCLAKSIELVSNLSIKKVKKSIWPILDIEFKDTLTNQTFVKRMQVDANPMADLLKKLLHAY